MKKTNLKINSVKLANKNVYYENPTTKTTTFQSCRTRTNSALNNSLDKYLTNNKLADLGAKVYQPQADPFLAITRKFINPNSSQPLNRLQALAEKNNNSSRGLQLLDKIAKPTNKWPGLMFLHKKGLSHTKPNFNFINYHFSSGAFLNKDGELVTPNYNVNKILLNNVYKLLVLFFKTMYCIISKPVFIFTQDTIKIQLFYFACIGRNISLRSKKGVDLVKDRKRMGIGSAKKVVFNNFFSKLTKVYPKKFKFICAILSKFFNKKVELDLIRLHKPYFNSEIFVNFLSLIINRKDVSKSIYKIFASKSMNNLFLANINKDKFLVDSTVVLDPNLDLQNKADNLIRKREKSIQLADNWFGLSEYFANNDVITSRLNTAYLTGMNIKISGRLRREPVIPKVTTKKFEKGFTAKGRINYSEMARFTHKNRKGAFSITINAGQNF